MTFGFISFVELDILFCAIFFYVWNALWYFMSFIFQRVERGLVFCDIFMCVGNALCFIFHSYTLRTHPGIL